MFQILKHWLYPYFFQGYLSERATLIIHTINLVLLLVIPAAVVLHYHPNPGKI